MERKFRPYDPEQQFLLPPSVQEFVPEGHLSHFVREVVMTELDLSSVEGEYTESRGAPPYSPRMMTALLLYGFTQGVYSSRKLSRACEERLDFMSVSGLNKPQFRAIAEFRKRHLESLGDLFLQVVSLCKKANLIKLGHVALDGTKMKANASKEKNKKYKDICREEEELKQSIGDWLKKGLAADEAEDEEYGEERRGDELPAWVSNKAERKKRLAEARESLEREKAEQEQARKAAEDEGTKPRNHQRVSSEVSAEKRYNFTDPESGLMKTHGGFIQGYNAQLAVEAGSYIIVGCGVSRASNDRDELRPMLKQLQETFGELPQELSVDNGYASNENLQRLEESKVRGYVALKGEQSRTNIRAWTAPAAKRMLKRLQQGGKKSRYHLRKQTVEPVFGILKAARGFSSFLLRGLLQVQSEWKLLCAAHNLTKLYQQRA